MNDNKPILSVSHLTKKFVPHGSFFSLPSKASITAIDDISFSINRGEIVGLLGRNGAGKTSTIHMLTGTLKPTSGTITYFGKDFSLHRSETLQHISFASGSVQLPALLTVWQNLDIYARLYGLSKSQRWERIEELLKTFGIWHLRNSKIGYISSGEITRVILVKAFIASPRFVLIDEATSNLDPEIARYVRKFVRSQRREQHLSVLLASHNMVEVAEMCDRVLVLDHGKIIAQDTPSNLIRQISSVRVSFVADESMERMKKYFTENTIEYIVNVGVIECTIEDGAIAPLLQKFAHEAITYSYVSIAKPTLENYFLQTSTTDMSIERSL